VKAKQAIHAGGSAGSAGESRCTRCGAPFHCGLDDPGGCWCAKLPPLPREAYAGDATCLCEGCLRQAIGGRPAEQSKSGD
jgi:hypothetical protein